MLNPLEMNFYGTRNDGSLAYMEEISVPNRTAVDSYKQRQSNLLELKRVENQDANNDGGVKRDRKGKWMHSDKGKRSKTDPYPSPSKRRYPYADKGLPKSLQELFTPVKCNLCKCIMGSAATNKDHYSGKKHRLNIKKWFLIHPEYQGIGYSNYFVPQPKIMDPNKLYCKHCDVMLSSEQQVESHYLGKRHQSIIKGEAPKNAYFNPIKRQWERFQKDATEGRHGIGLEFRDYGLEKQVVGKELIPLQKCFCEICMVACPSEITFNEHLTGAKHKKKIALVNSEIYFATRSIDVEEASREGANTPRTSDLSIYRTPTGKYYCSICNVTVNSPTQFVQHSESKKHKIKAILPVAPPPPKFF